MNPELLQYLRETNPQLKSIPDSELSAYLQERRPDILHMAGGQQQQAPQQVNHAANVKGILSSGPTRFAKGLSEFTSGQPEAGLMNVASGVAETVASPIGVATYGLKNASQAPGMSAVAPPLEAIGRGVEAVAQAPVDLKRALFSFLGDKAGVTEEDVIAGLNYFRATKGAPPLDPAQGQNVIEAGQTATDIGAQVAAVPAARTGARMIGGRIARALPKELPTNIETRAIKQKIPTSGDTQVFKRTAETAVKEDYAPTDRGLKKLDTDLERYNAESKNIADIGSQQGKTIAVRPIYDKLNKLVDDAKNSANKPEVMAAVNFVKSRIGKVSKQYKGNIPLSAAQELKTSLYDMIGKGFEKKNAQGTGISGYEKDVIKSASQAVLDGMIKAEPALREIGLKQRDLIKLRESLAPRVMGMAKSDLMSWGTTRKAGFALGAGAAFNPAVGMGVLAGEMAATSPTFLHALAVMIDRGKKMSAISKGKPIIPIPKKSFIPPLQSGDE